MTLWLDAEILGRFCKQGWGYETRINVILRKYF
jgi:uncharacterized protein (DUF4415 family)